MTSDDAIGGRAIGGDDALSMMLRDIGFPDTAVAAETLSVETRARLMLFAAQVWVELHRCEANRPEGGRAWR